MPMTMGMAISMYTNTDCTLGTERLHILVVGLGNLLLQDDGVGIHVIRALQQEAPPGVCIADVGCAVLDALHLYEWADKILAIDAMQAGHKPGTIYRFDEEAIADVDMPMSLHEVSIKSAFRFLPEPPKAEVTFLAVEPGTIDYGLDLTPEVAASLPHVVRIALEIIDKWQRQDVVYPSGLRLGAVPSSAVAA